MIIKLFENWDGIIKVNDEAICDLDDIPKSGHAKIFLCAEHVQNTAQTTEKVAIQPVNGRQEYKITVKQYMTKQADPSFDFMAKWNNNIPMPLRTMVGTIEKETMGMLYMRLHGKGEPVVTCMRCGKSLTNPISRHYGIGPDCMQKLGIVADIDDVEGIKKKLVDVTWEGWIIKSAITEKEAV